MAKFTKSIQISTVNSISEQLKNAQIGQWIICNETGIRGQYLGSTKNSDVIHWIKGAGKFNTTFAMANKPLRRFAVIYGAK